MEKQKEFGRSRPKDFYVVSGPIFAHLAENREKGWDEAEAGFHWSIDFYRRRGAPMPLAPIGEFRKPENALAYGMPIPVGRPEDVLKMLSAYRNEPIDEIGIGLYHPGQDIETVKRSIRLFAKEVLPEIKRWG